MLDFDTVTLDEERDELIIIDQTRLPNETVFLHLTKPQDVWDAIYTLKVRGAPAIGVAAAIGFYLAAKAIIETDFHTFYQKCKSIKEYLSSSRPTAVNLFWALDRMERVLLEHAAMPVPQIKEALKREAISIKEEDISVCRTIGENGLSLIHDGDGILTHCNAGQLAAVRYGTALAPIHLGKERGYHFRVFTDETRPLLQGIRLSAYELSENGIDTTVICDNMASQVMKNGWIQAVLVGCDRVAANGDTCNKIGTSGVAILAKYYHIPFYVCAPSSTIDMRTPCGDGITIEQRSPDEIVSMWYRDNMAPDGAKVYNPAFDVTPHHLVTAFVTEKGIIYPPYDKNFKKIFG